MINVRELLWHMDRLEREYELENEKKLPKKTFLPFSLYP